MRLTTRSTLLASALFVAVVFLAMAAPAPLTAQRADAASAAKKFGFGSGTDATPTFYADVLPVLQQNCQVCHQSAGLNMGGMVAPWPLVTYEDARMRAPRIASAVREGRMPPWSAADWHKGTFTNERVLEDEEKATLISWAEGGTPAGNPADAPPTPQFVRVASESNGWSRGEPDLIIEWAEPYCLDDDITDKYINLPAQITEEMLPEDRWIKSIEFRNGPAVHHIISTIGSLVPGAEPTVFEEGYGRVMRAGPREVRFQMHFSKEPGPGTGVCTNIQAGIIFKEDGEVIRHVTGGTALQIDMGTIPAGNGAYSASMEYVFPKDVEILSFLPHMHLRGKAALYEITYPDGRHETLLHVPNYAFNWQHTYEFAEPPQVPAGSKMRFTLWWDNSEDNPNNPDPTVDVVWGQPTDAEMSQGYMGFRTPQERRIVVGEPIPDDIVPAWYAGPLDPR